MTLQTRPPRSVNLSLRSTNTGDCSAERPPPAGGCRRHDRCVAASVLRGGCRPGDFPPRLLEPASGRPSPAATTTRPRRSVGRGCPTGRRGWPGCCATRRGAAQPATWCPARGKTNDSGAAPSGVRLAKLASRMILRGLVAAACPPGAFGPLDQAKQSAPPKSTCPVEPHPTNECAFRGHGRPRPRNDLKGRTPGRSLGRGGLPLACRAAAATPECRPATSSVPAARRAGPSLLRSVRQPLRFTALPPD